MSIWVREKMALKESNDRLVHTTMEQPFFYWCFFSKKRNQISKIQKSSSFGGFWSSQV
jgi:hypothetical protein